MKEKLKNSIEINRKNKDYVGADDPVRQLLKRNTQNGITLVALVITIIVLLILAGISIKIAVSGGLIERTQGAVKTNTEKTQKEAIELGYSAYLIDKAKNGSTTREVEGATVEETSDGFEIIFPGEKNIKYILTEDGKITGPETVEKTEDDIAMEKYVLGEELKGQAIAKIIDTENGNFYQLNGKPVELLTPDIICYSSKKQEMPDGATYAKYNNKAYRIVIDFNGDGSDVSKWTTKSVAMIYEPKGKEGQKVKYSYDGTQANNKEWTVIYDNGSSVEIISPESIGNLKLGGEDIEAQGNNEAEKAIYSYNHAIERINNYTTSLVTNTNKISVRSTGSNPNNPNSRNTEKYRSDFLANWTPNGSAVNYGFTTLNGVAERGDNNLEKDFVRMVYWGISSTGSEYWLASRCFSADSDNVDFGVDYVNSYDNFCSGNLFGADSSGVAYTNSYECAVRPVVKISLNS